MAPLPARNSTVVMSQLDDICSPVHLATQIRIATAFWGASIQTDYTPTSLQPYFEYYTQQCKIMYHSFGTKLPFSRHEGIIQLAQDIKCGLTRQEVVQNLEARCPGIIPNAWVDVTETLNGAVDLAARLLLMVDVGKPASDRIWTRRAFRRWEESTIYDFTSNIFPVQRSNRHDGIQLDTDFNARNLDAIGGLKVELTNNLLDHLEVVDIEGETTIMIFHHASFLKNQKHPYFPAGFVEETLQTLALLFPQNRWYKDTRTWYYKHLAPVTPDLDASVLTCGPLTMTNIDAYQFWHDRLVRLKLLFDQAKPRTLRQWWNDRREGTQWYALWVAVGFTIFFGIVQSIEGALQVYKAYHPTGGQSG
ncbi:Homeobox domain-containing protein [Madurella fahalii]|uniref:Homeobox domain-containing protein n=1 Tax=Madurella fahalii TaxID=1157608 RepID=A0ABQ0G506_9PEZI